MLNISARAVLLTAVLYTRSLTRALTVHRALLFPCNIRSNPDRNGQYYSISVSRFQAHSHTHTHTHSHSHSHSHSLCLPLSLSLPQACAIRCVTTSDFMTADWYHMDYALLGKIANRIINECRGINRVCYDVSSKPPATIEWE